MTGACVWLVEHMVVWLLPARDRDSIIGDLTQECQSSDRVHRAWKIQAILRIAAHYQAEPYRDADQRIASLTVGLAALVVLWIVPEASAAMFPDPDFLRQPVIRFASTLWNASHVTSAIAAGLVVGRASWLPEVDAPVRWHIAGLLAIVPVLTAPTVAAAVVAVATFGLTTWLGDEARRAARPDVA